MIHDHAVPVKASRKVRKAQICFALRYLAILPGPCWVLFLVGIGTSLQALPVHSGLGPGRPAPGLRHAVVRRPATRRTVAGRTAALGGQRLAAGCGARPNCASGHAAAHAHADAAADKAKAHAKVTKADPQDKAKAQAKAEKVDAKVDAKTAKTNINADAKADKVKIDTVADKSKAAAKTEGVKAEGKADVKAAVTK